MGCIGFLDLPNIYFLLLLFPNLLLLQILFMMPIHVPVIMFCLKFNTTSERIPFKNIVLQSKYPLSMKLLKHESINEIECVRSDLGRTGQHSLLTSENLYNYSCETKPSHNDPTLHFVSQLFN